MTRGWPRRLHAGAWWLWALGLVLVSAQTRNPILSAAIVAVCILTVAARSTAEERAGGFRVYLAVAGMVVIIRLLFRMLLGGDYGTEVVFRLPSLGSGGVTVGGAVTVEEMLAGLYDGLRLGAIVVCVGTANILADPRRLVAIFPRAVGALATSVVVALSLAPQLVVSMTRVRRARRLRGETGRGWRGLRSLLVPLLEDTLQRSISLAASMDSRGYGRWNTPAGRGSTRAMLWFGLAATCAGMFGVLTSSSTPLPAMVLIVGLSSSVAGLHRMGRGLSSTRYRPDPWAAPEWIVAASGLVAAAGVFLAGALDPGLLQPSLQPPIWPSLSAVALGAVMVGALPVVMAPRPPSTIPQGAVS